MADSIENSPINSKTWCAERLFHVLKAFGIESFLEEGLEFYKSRRAVDFFVSPGSITARVQDKTKAMPRSISISMPVIEDVHWGEIMNDLGKQSLFLAKLLASEMPPQIEEVFIKAGAVFLPNSIDLLQISFDGEELSSANKYVAILYHLIAERFEKDPFAVLTFRGRGKEQIISDLQSVRNQLKAGYLASSSLSYYPVDYEPVASLEESIQFYWSVDPAVRELSYDIRADELPASVLSRLDPLPFPSLESDIASGLEDVYVRVARRAQALGLGLK